jgi:uncharacterized membrane protein
MKHTFKSILVLATVLIAIACSKKTAPTTTADPANYTGPKVSYAQDIAPLMQRSCSPCHYPNQDGKKQPLDSYAAVKDELVEVLERVQLEPGSLKYMPFKQKKEALTPAEIEMLKNWARGGFAE